MSRAAATWTLRPFEALHIEAARALWIATPGVGLSAADEPAALTMFLARNPGLSFAAQEPERGDLWGTILCGHDGRRGLIHHLVVAQPYRRQGLGQALLHAGLRALAQAGIAKAHLLVFRSNEAGHAFWREIGAQERVEMSLFSIDTQPLS